MSDVLRTIGLSLGADLCWPLCYEAILNQLDPEFHWEGETIRVRSERRAIEPFDLRGPCPYDVMLDRVTHWYHASREWIKKAVLMDDLYVLNNPWSIQSMEKHTSYCAMMRLGMPVPDTWMVPPKEYEETADLEPTLARYAKLFDIRDIGERVGYPHFIKPYDGGAWVGVTRIDSGDDLARAYDESGTRLMHLQRAVDPHDLFVRCVGIGPQVRMIKYNPSAPLHDRYEVNFQFLEAEEAAVLSETTLTINSFFGWDFNSCEALRQNGTFFPIDFANGCPDSQVTSLHYHFPWLVKSMLRWSLFCAVTKRRMRRTLNWDPYYDISDDDAPYREKLRRYAALAHEHFDTDAFNAFCEEQLGDLDAVALEFFGSDDAFDAVRQKVAALFPAHEVEMFTAHFWGMIQFWRSTESDRLRAATVAPVND